MYYGSVVAYDETLNPVDSDMRLADAIWRYNTTPTFILIFSYSSFFRNVFGTADTSAVVLEKLVEYVRKEANHLDNMDDIVMSGKVKWGSVPSQ